MLLKYSTQYVWQFGKASSGQRTGRGQSSSQFPRRAVLKNVQATEQLHSSPILVRLCSKSSMLGFSIMWTQSFQMFKLGLEKHRNQRSNCQHLLEHRKSKWIPEKHLLHWSHQTVWITTKWEILKKLGMLDQPYLCSEKPVHSSKNNS